jgi:tRNA (mo5U34)-methyltransferase
MAPVRLESLRGKSLLDVGGVDGAYAFRAERARAAPVAVLDPLSVGYRSRRLWPALPGAHSGWQSAPAPHETDLWGPEQVPARWRFDTARQLLSSKVEAVTEDFMKCDLPRLGTWDVVLYLGVLYQMEDPLRALRRLARVTREQAIIETEAIAIPGYPEPLWRFFPGASSITTAATAGPPTWPPCAAGSLPQDSRERRL